MKLRFLDGLRGIAAFIVLIHHYFAAFLPLAINGVGPNRGVGEWLIYSTPLQLLVAGNLSVCIFFVLSAIVLSSKFFRTADDSVVVASAGKRFFRLAIPAIGSLVIAYLFMKLGLYFTVPASQISQSTWWAAIWSFPPHLKDVLSQAFYGVWITGDNTYNRVLWTMQIEFIGSFIVFAYLLLFGKMRYRWVVYAILAFLFRHDYYLAFVLGLVLSDIYHHFNTVKQTILRFWLWVPLLIVGLVLGSYPVAATTGTIFAKLHLPFLLPDQQTAFVHIIAAFCIVLSVLVARPLQRLLTTRVPLFLGRISFSFYLLHQTVMGSYSDYLIIHMTHAGVGYRTTLLVTFIPTVILSILVAYLYTRYVDEPAIIASGKIYHFLSRGRSPLPAEDGAVAAGDTKLHPSPAFSAAE